MLSVGGLLFKMAPSLVLSAVSCFQTPKAVTCLLEKICVLGKLHSGRSHSAVGCELSINESIVYIESDDFEHKHINPGYILIS